jgi:2-methylisocitrate lyase-like PEP mutase family enzyme
VTQIEKATLFRALHKRDGAFLVPNPWDAGSARLLALLGFEALATTSAGYAFSIGQRDSTVDRQHTMEHAAAIASATDLPVSGDLENGFGDSPEDVATTVALAARAGLVGGSIEDATGQRDQPVYERALAVERIVAAAAVARDLPFPFTLTARAENYLRGRPDLKDTIERLQAYQVAGANVLYAPGLTHIKDIATVVRSVDCPVNVVMGLQGTPLSLAQLSAVGVKRVSVGSALARAALGEFLRAAREMQDRGSFTFAENAVRYEDINAMFRDLTPGKNGREPVS